MKQALIIVDIQNDYFAGGKMELVKMAVAAENAVSALELFRTKNMPIFHIQHVSSRPDAGFFLPDTHGVEIHQSVTPKSSEPVIQKHFPNSFRDTALQGHLRDIKVEEIVICGAMTHMCIDTTVRAAFDLGYRCLLISDACATKDLEFGSVKVKAAQVHAAYMAGLSAAFAKIIQTNELENLLQQQ